ncbi:helix-turn-helix domain-containing protein [Clostridium estertheticum]|uniref:helix-turn-helix domain-containing protein n=1 Tax=Clostridium estertheticum TaxID=238834 RepID=UPI000A06B9AA|nr:helix-turn-helix transcriptional regulator [Clostridium estertheticum]
MDEYRLRIREKRLVKRMTQMQLAAKVGISRNFLSEIERGKYDIHLSLLCKFSRALNSSPGNLIEYKK